MLGGATIVQRDCEVSWTEQGFNGWSISHMTKQYSRVILKIFHHSCFTEITVSSLLESALDLVTFNIFLLQMNIFHTTGNKFYLQKLKSMPKNAI